MTKDRPKPPTAEEEQAKLDKTIAEAEALKNKDKKKIDDLPDNPEDLKKDKDKPEDKDKDKDKPKPKDKDKDKDKPEDKDKDKDKPKPKDQPYKKRYIESTKEGQVLYAKNKKLTEAFKKSKEIPEPTEDELKREYSDWEDLSPDEQKRAKDALTTTRRFKALEGVNQEFEDIDKWQKKVKGFIDDPANLSKNPLLEGKEAEFTAFASKPTRRGVDFEDLIKAFLFDVSTDEDGKPIKKKKGKQFPSGSGGDKNVKPKSNKISMDDARRLRVSNYAKYKKYLTAGMIEDEF